MKPLLKNLVTLRDLHSRDVFFVLIVVTILFLFKSQNLELKLANDFSTLSYVNSPAESESPIGEPHNIVAKIYKASLVMRIFRAAVEAGVISPLLLSYVFLFFLIGLFVGGSYFLSSSLFNKSTTSQIFVFLLVTSSFSNANLSAYFIGGFHNMLYPLFYGISHGLGFFALGFYFRKQSTLALFFLVMAFLNHLSIGLFYIGALVFISFANPMKYEIKVLLKALLALVLTGVVAIFFLIPKSSGPSLMDPMWLSLMKSFGSHWFMLSSDILMNHFKLVTYPLIAISVCLPMFRFTRGTLAIRMFVVYVLLLTLVGFVCTEVFPNEMLIKVSPQRVSFLFPLAFTLGISQLLGEKLNYGRFSFDNFIVVIIIGLLSLLTPALSILIVGFVVYSTWPNSPKWRKAYSIFIIVLFGLVIAFSCFGNFYGQLRIKPGDFLWGGSFNSHPKYFVYGVGIILATSICFGIASHFNFRRGKILFSIVLFTLLAAKMSFEESNWVLNKKSRVQDLVEVQKWVRDTTEKDAGVWVDPVYGASWNSHSLRRKVGSFRDWSYYYLAYSSQFLNKSKWFFSLFSIDLDRVFKSSMAEKKIANALSVDFRAKFESLSADQLRDLSKELHFDYLVISIRHGENLFDEFPLVFKNNSYRVLQINSEVF